MCTKFWSEILKERFNWEKLRRRWKDNFKMDLEEIGWGVDWIGCSGGAGCWFTTRKFHGSTNQKATV
jgi:hypothetical protein